MYTHVHAIIGHFRSHTNNQFLANVCISMCEEREGVKERNKEQRKKERESERRALYIQCIDFENSISLRVIRLEDVKIVNMKSMNHLLQCL